MVETKIDFEHLSLPEALKQLDVDLKICLSSAAAQRRLAQYGLNALEEKKVSPFATCWLPTEP